MSHSFPELSDVLLQSVRVCVLEGGHGEGLPCMCLQGDGGIFPLTN